MENKVCTKPFTRLEIYEDGYCGCCCPPFTDNYFIGNFFKDSIDDIWNGKKIRKLRKTVLDNSYKLCHTDMCANTDCIHEASDEFTETVTKYPEVIDLCIDNHCNCKCVMCRDTNNRIDEDIYNAMKKMEILYKTKLIPLIRDCKLLVLNGSGELFVSEICKNLIKETAKLYPQLQYDLVTNGILCTKQNLEDLGILNNRISHLSMSIHSVTKKTYNKIVRPLDKNAFEKVMNNIQELNTLVKQNKIYYMSLNFVISSLNYEELPLMAEFCIKNEINGRFWEFRKRDEDSKMNEEYEKYNVTNENHCEYKKLKKILQNNIFNSPYIHLNGILYDIKNS